MSYDAVNPYTGEHYALDQHETLWYQHIARKPGKRPQAKYLATGFGQVDVVGIYSSYVYRALR